jgi:hypothetical protein
MQKTTEMEQLADAQEKKTAELELQSQARPMRRQFDSTKTQDALNQLSQGKKTCNQVRKEFGLDPIDSPEFNILIAKV